MDQHAAFALSILIVSKELRKIAVATVNVFFTARPLTVSDLDSCVALENAAYENPQERCSPEKVSPFSNSSACLSHSLRDDLCHALGFMLGSTSVISFFHANSSFLIRMGNLPDFFVNLNIEQALPF